MLIAGVIFMPKKFSQPWADFLSIIKVIRLIKMNLKINL